MKRFVHLTPADRLESIITNGLEAGRPPELSAEVAWTMDWYGINPVFLSEPNSEFLGAHRDGIWAGHAEIEVDVEGLELVADLASLVDIAARLDDNGWLYWRRRDLAPVALQPYLDENDAIEIDRLLDPAHPACGAAIQATGTAACLSTIGIERLSTQPALMGRMR